MNRFSRTETQLIHYLYNRDGGTGTGVTLLNMDLGLQENDPISRIRELVFYVEKLEREGVIETDPNFYTESDHMSFTYLNSAVEIEEKRVHLTEEGRRVVTDSMVTGIREKFGNAYAGIMDVPETKNVLQILCGLAFMMGAAVGILAGRTF